ncbi:MAG: hypothetical protein QGI87_06870, partial [Candidatus Bathyarchaeota archaeon]|nr:hypothetical protein [Candidatus Bathyarchaeota archaeon]
MISNEVHKRLPKDLFNLIWDFLDKVDRTGDENLRMTHAARASQYHWGRLASPSNSREENGRFR